MLLSKTSVPARDGGSTAKGIIIVQASVPALGLDHTCRTQHQRVKRGGARDNRDRRRGPGQSQGVSVREAVAINIER